MTSIRLLAACLLLTASPVVARPGPVASVVVPAPVIPTETAADELALGKDYGGRMTVAVEIGGKGPYRFLVDTGSERTVISRQLAERLGLEVGQRTMLHSVVSANRVDTVLIPSMTVSKKTFSVIDAPALEASNIGADGMLGIDSLRAQKVMFDFKGKTMSISRASKRPEAVDPDEIVVRARSRNGRLIFTQARIDGQKVTVIVDTGSQVTIGNMALQRSLVRRGAWIAPDPATIQSVTGEKLYVQVALVDELELGGVNLKKLAVAFADSHIFRQLNLEDSPALLLGMNAMRAFDRISIDFAAKRVRFVLPGMGMLDTFRMAELERR